MDYKTLIKHQYQKLLLVALLIVVGFGFYKVYSAFFQRVDYIWQARYQYDYAQVLMLARNNLEKAQFDLEFACSGLTSGLSQGLSCEEAKQNYEKAKQNYERVMADKDKIFDVPGQVKGYYDAVILAAKQTPLPFLLLVLTLSSLVVVAVFLIREFTRK